MKYPIILRLLIPLVVGVIIHFYTQFSCSLNWLTVFLLLVIVLGSTLLRKLKWNNFFFSGSYIVLFFLLGGYLSAANTSSENENYFYEEGDQWNNYLVEVIDPPQEKERSVKCVVEVLQLNEELRCGKSLIYLQKDSSVIMPKYGDQLCIRAKFSPIRSNGNPKEFDYARYLKIHDIREQTYIKTESWKLVGHDANPFFEQVYQTRSYLSSTVQNSGMSEKNAMVANALLLGQKEYLDKDVLRSYSSAGAMHVLAVSGLHVGIVMLILTFLLTPVKRLKFGKRIFIISVLGGIWFYALITGLSPSVMRAAVMFTFIVIGKELQRDSTVYQSIMVSAFLLILYEPYIIFQVGFQLSYLAVLGIVFLQPKIENLVYIKNKILFKAWQISAVSIAAQIATFPLGLYYFHQFPNFFLLSNLLVIPLAFFILMVGIAYLVFHLVPVLNDILFWLFDGMISLLNWGVELVQRLPYSIMWGISIEWYEVFALYMTILLGSIAFMYRKSKVLIASMIACVMLLLLNIYEDQKLSHENVVCVYNVNDELAIDIFYGRSNVFYSSEVLFADEEKMLFHVKHNWFYRTGEEQPTEWQNIDSIRYLQYGDYQLGLLDENNHSEIEENIPILDVVVVHDIDFISQPILEVFQENETTLVLADHVGYSLKSYIEGNYPTLPIYDLKSEGAFLSFF